jgi:hypothetical protein
MNQLNIDNELKDLAMAYIKAHNDKRYTDAELILHDLEVMKKLTSDKHGTNTTELR